MKKKLGTRVLITGALIAALVGGTSISASAALNTVTAGGGLHQYGIENGLNKSHYYHQNVSHRSSVKNSTGEVKRSATVGANAWARVTQTATPSGNQAFWAHV